MNAIFLLTVIIITLVTAYSVITFVVRKYGKKRNSPERVSQEEMKPLRQLVADNGRKKQSETSTPPSGNLSLHMPIEETPSSISNLSRLHYLQQAIIWRELLESPR